MSHKTLLSFTLVGALSLLAEQGTAQNSSSRHQGAWPVQNGFNHQPTEDELHDQDVPSGDARKVDQLYDQLMSTGEHDHGAGSANSH